MRPASILAGLFCGGNHAPPQIVGIGPLLPAIFLVGICGVVLAPEAAYAWVVAMGVANGAMFALVLTLPLDLEDEPRRVGALVGMMLGLGYTIGAVSLLVLGAIRDATGSFAAPLWIIIAFSGLLVVAAAALPKAREVGASG